MSKRVFFSVSIAAAVLSCFAPMPARAQAPGPIACPPVPIQVVRSRGGVIDNHGSVPAISDLCRVTRSGETGDYYYGLWRTDWPGAGDAYPAIKAVMLGGLNARSSFVTRSIPGMQWVDTFVNEGTHPIDVDGRSYNTLRIMHERSGIEGNTYHSLITIWRDVKTGVALQTFEQQISGQSYGPETTWQAVKVQPMLPSELPDS